MYHVSGVGLFSCVYLYSWGCYGYLVFVIIVYFYIGVSRRYSCVYILLSVSVSLSRSVPGSRGWVRLSRVV